MTVLALIACSLVLAQPSDSHRSQQFMAEGIRLFQEDRLEEAADLFLKAVAVDPTNVDAQNDLCVVLRRQKKLSEALAACDTAVRLRPQEARIHSTLALVLQDMGRIAEALAAME